MLLPVLFRGQLHFLVLSNIKDLNVIEDRSRQPIYLSKSGTEVGVFSVNEDT